MTPKQIAKVIRQAARDRVYPPYHYDTIDAQIAAAFEQLAQAFEEFEEEPEVSQDTDPEAEACPFTFSHTRRWCGNPGCRES